MNWFFNKKYRLGFGFGVIIFIVAGTLVMTMITLQRSYDINRKINDKYVPSIGRLQDLESYTLRSKDLIKEWAFPAMKFPPVYTEIRLFTLNSN